MDKDELRNAGDFIIYGTYDSHLITGRGKAEIRDESLVILHKEGHTVWVGGK